MALVAGRASFEGAVVADSFFADGVRRAGVSLATHPLRQRRVHALERCGVTSIDRAGLIVIA